MQSQAKVAVDPVQGFPLSPQQLHLWELQRSAPDAPYRAVWAARIEGDVDGRMLRRAVERCAARHEILRTRFRRLPGMTVPVQVIDERLEIDFAHLDLTAATATAQAEALRRLDADRARPLDCEAGPVVRVRLATLASGRHRLSFDLPALCADAASLDNLAAEVLRGCAGDPDSGEVVQYADVAAWQNGLLVSDDTEEGRRFWRRRDFFTSSQVTLPYERPASPTEPFAPAVERSSLDGATTGAVDEVARALGVPPRAVLLAAFHALLARLAETPETTVGAVVAGRRFEDLERSVGLFERALPVTVATPPESSFEELTGRVAAALEELEVWQDYFSWSLVPGWRDGREAPPWLPWTFRDGERPPRRELAGCRVVGEERSARTDRFTGSLAAERRGERLELELQHDRHRLAPAAARCLLAQYGALLAAAVRRPGTALRELPLAGDDERAELVERLNRTAVDFGPPLCLHELLERQARSTPDRVAVTFGGAALTYQELDRRADLLAEVLRRCGVAAEDRVALFLDRSLEMIVALIAVLKAGGAYVALDTRQPAKRLEMLLADVAPRAVVSDTSLSARLPAGGAQTVLVDAPGAPESPAGAAAEPSPDADRLAYVLFTSGSTGRPKGVMVSHRAIVNRLLWMQRELPLDAGDRLLQKTPLVFDASIWEIFVPLLAGATVVVAPPGAHRDTGELAAAIDEERVTILQLVPTLLAAFLDEPRLAGESLRRLFAGGERLAPAMRDRAFQRLPGVELHNLYGPTEAAIDASHWQCEPDERGVSVPIGRPIDNLRLVLLDTAGRPVAVGEPGEIHIGGAGLARGYFGRPALTAARFLPDRFAAAGARTYRTGDLGRLRPDGAVEFLGRLDGQVKVRGVRVEPGEIEAVLGGHPAMTAAAVVAREGAAGHLQLVAYAVPRAGAQVDAGVLREYLAERLPDSMLPAQWVLLDELPVTTSGKVDRRALPLPEAARNAAGTGHVAPTRPAERVLASIWQEVLGLERVGVHDDFFALGGDSIVSLQVVGRAAGHGIRFTVQQLFERPTIAGLLEIARAAAAPAASERGAVAPRTPAQQVVCAHASMLLAIAPGLPARIVARAFAALLEHHEALRARFDDECGQRFAAAGGAGPFLHVDLAALPAARQRGEAERHGRRFHHLLDARRGPVVAGCLSTAGPDRPASLLIVAHGLVADGRSCRILAEDLATACGQLLRGEAPALSPPPISWADWCRRLAEHARSSRLEAEEAYWEEAVPGPEVMAPLPPDLPSPRPESTGRGVETVTLTFGARVTAERLRQAARAYRASPQELLLAGLARVLERWSGNQGVLVDLERGGRDAVLLDVDPSRTVGRFASVHPVWLAGFAACSPVGAVRRVKEQLQAVPRGGSGYALLRHQWPEEVPRRLGERGRAEVILLEPRGLEAVSTGSSLVEPAAVTWRRDPAPAPPFDHSFEIGIADEGRGPCLLWSYRPAVHRRATVEALAEDLRDELVGLLDDRQAARGALVPADFPLAGLDGPALEALLADPHPLADVYPLSPLQEGLLFHALHDSGSGVYVQQLSCLIEGVLDEEAFRRAWAEVLDRHPVLRTEIADRGTKGHLQVVREEVPLPIELREAPVPRERWAELGPSHLLRERQEGFELGRAPLMRVVLFRFGERVHRLIWSYHHLVLDGWSVSMLLHELFSIYRALRAGGEPPALEERRPYRDYIAWIEGQDLVRAERFWRSTLAGFRTPTPLPFDRPAGAERRRLADDHGQVETALSPAATASLREAARRHRVTLNTMVQAAWALLLSRYSGRLDVVFGAVSGGRPPTLAGAERMIGVFLSSLPVRVQLDPRASLGEWLQEVQRRQARSRDVEFAPLSKVQAWSEVPPGQPLFETILAFDNHPVEDALREQEAIGLQVSDVHFIGRTNYPLSLAVVPDDSLRLLLVFDLGRMDRAAVERIAGHLGALLESMGERPDGALAELSMMPAAERREVLLGFAGQQATGAPSGGLETVRPTAADDVSDGAARLAALLPRVSTNGDLEIVRVLPDLRSYVLDEAGEPVPVGVPGRLHLDAADWLAPQLDRAADAADALRPDAWGGVVGARLWSTGRRARRLPGGELELLGHRAAETEPAEEVEALVAAHPRVREAAVVRADDASGAGRLVAYVVEREDAAATVGDGLQVSILNRNEAEVIYREIFEDECYLRHGVQIGDGDCVFDVGANIGLFSLYVHDRCRGAMVYAFEPVAPVRERLAQNAERYGLAVRVMPYGLLDRNGEQELIFYPRWSGMSGIHADAAEDASVTRAFLRNQLGEALALEADAMLEQRFEQQRLRCAFRRLSDVVREEGIERIDLLKVDVERSELEVLRGIDDEHWQRIDQVVVEAHDAGGRAGAVRRLLAEKGFDTTVDRSGLLAETGLCNIYAVHPRRARRSAADRRRLLPRANGSGSLAEALEAHVAGRLPSALVPVEVVVLDALPRSARGDVDRRRLARRDGAAPSAARPRTPVEEALTEIWCQVLGLETVAVDDDFIELGGDSILGLQVASRARQAGYALKTRDVFEFPTVAGLARRVAETASAAGTTEGAEPVSPVLTPIQHRFFAADRPSPHHFNQATLLEVRGPLPADRLRRALASLVERHDALRSRFRRSTTGEWSVSTCPREEAPLLAVEDLSALPEGEQEAALTARAGRAQASLDLENGPLLRAVRFDLGHPRPSLLLVVVHHLVVDAVSWRILLEDIERSLAQLESGDDVDLAAVTTSYARWSRQLAEHAASADLEAELPHWRRACAAEVPPLPRDRADGEATVARAATARAVLAAEATAALLQRVPEASGARVDEVLLTALAQTLSAWTGNRSLRLDLEGHGRDEDLAGGGDLSRTVGWFTAAYPMLVELPAEQATAAALRAVKEQVRAVPRRGIGYGLLRYLSPRAEVRRELGRMPPSEVIFNYLGQYDSALAGASRFALAERPIGPGRAAEGRLDHLLSIDAYVAGGVLRTGWTYSSGALDAATVESLAARYVEALERLIEHCLSADAAGHTPSDFPDIQLDQDTLDRLLAEVEFDSPEGTTA